MVLTRIPKTGSHFSECALNQLIWQNRNSALTICQEPVFSGLKLSLNVLIYDTYQAGMVAFSYALQFGILGYVWHGACEQKVLEPI